MPFYPQNSVQPQCRTRSKPNLNIIFVLIIVTHAQGFVPVKKYGGQVYLAAVFIHLDCSVIVILVSFLKGRAAMV